MPPAAGMNLPVYRRSAPGASCSATAPWSSSNRPRSVRRTPRATARLAQNRPLIALNLHLNPLRGFVRDRPASGICRLAVVHARDDMLAVVRQRRVLGVVLEVEREVADAQAGELAQAADVLLGRPDEAEPIDDLVGDEADMVVGGAAVAAVVVALAL